MYVNRILLYIVLLLISHNYSIQLCLGGGGGGSFYGELNDDELL